MTSLNEDFKEILMNLSDIGFGGIHERYLIENNLKESEVGRVSSVHREFYVVQTIQGEVEAEITGHFRYCAESQEDFPAVGDWVVLTVIDQEFATIHRVFPRYSIISRQSVGQPGEKQIIAANIDYAFIVQAVDRDFNINRLERYLTICYSAHVSPVILLSKVDLISENQYSDIQEIINSRLSNVPVIAISNETEHGYDELKRFIDKRKTYCLLGSSGVGKSTLINKLYGKIRMRTGKISSGTNKGRHITTHRELVVLENGGILIDNPGMREVGITDTENGLEAAFSRISNLARKCRFRDCTHSSETGCAVLEALESGSLDKNYYANYLKIQKEKNYFETSISERHKKEKIFGKIQKKFSKNNPKRR